MADDLRDDLVVMLATTAETAKRYGAVITNLTRFLSELGEKIEDDEIALEIRIAMMTASSQMSAAIDSLRAASQGSPTSDIDPRGEQMDTDVFPPPEAVAGQTYADGLAAGAGLCVMGVIVGALLARILRR